MKHLLSILTVCLVAIASSAQNKADIEVSYTEHSPNLRNGKDDVTHQYILLANADESKFYSPITEYIDSLNSTPEGQAKYKEMTRGAFMSGKLDDMPRKDGDYYVTVSRKDNKLTYYDKAGLDSYLYEEELPEWNWEISDSTKTLLGYECIKATTDFHGRKWTAWVAPEIPLNAGPWKLAGLPGLILEATAEGGQYSFIADGIQQTSKEIIPIYLTNEYEKTDRISFLKAKRNFLDNPLGQINAQFGGGISISKTDSDNNDPIFASSSVVDLIETDYK